MPPPLLIAQMGPRGWQGRGAGVLSSYSRQQKSNWLNRSIQFRKGTQIWNANHTEMHSDNKMREREGMEGAGGGGGGQGLRWESQEEQGKWTGRGK